MSVMLAGKDEGNGPEKKLLPAVKDARYVSPANSVEGSAPVNEFSARARDHRLGKVSPHVLGMDPVKALLSSKRVVMLAGKVMGNWPVSRLP